MSCWGKELYSEINADGEDGRLIPKNHLAWVRIQAPFILKVEEIRSNTSWFPSASGWAVLITSSLQSLTGGPDQAISCEPNISTLA